ncbi:ABC transporter permease [Rhodopirellula sallentina]|uniref:ABC transporter, permease protein putative membrane protein n=1 Tax=Rhodopirellula sallentina SM41 TaxID=1263870 RepID=M5U947_9BACT|nr:ABC transporter permease [Rhodopirellula sallentina]EMI57987.1 ABC transporter, permease protein putative membrane protein [Rhodopirellula sallentina SM41]
MSVQAPRDHDRRSIPESRTTRTSRTTVSTPTSEALANVLSVSVVAVLGLLIWHISVRIFELPKILLPTPWEVAQAGWQNKEELCMASGVTFITAAISLLVAILIGGILSIIFSQSRLLRRAFFPYVVFLQTVPIVAIAPLLIIWSGYEFRTAVIATVIICLFPIVNNITTGLESSRPEHIDLFRLYGASRWQRLLRLQVPTSIRYLMLGARVSSGLAVIGAIVAEFFVSNGSDYVGLGALITRWQGLLQTDALIAALGMSTLLGLALFGLVNGIGRIFFTRYTRVD